MFKVTKRWVGEQGAWTAAMLKALGIEWPPFKGWVGALEGVEITQQQKAEVERLHAARLKQHAHSAERHAAMSLKVFWTTPNERGGFRVHRTRPANWDSRPQPEGELF